MDVFFMLNYIALLREIFCVNEHKLRGPLVSSYKIICCFFQEQMAVNGLELILFAKFHEDLHSCVMYNMHNCFTCMS